MREIEKWLVGLLLVFSVLLYSNQLLDYYHHSRFLALSTVTVLFSAYLLISNFSPNRAILSQIGIALTAFAAIAALSILWAAEKSEAIFYAQKWIYATSAYFLLLIVLSSLTFTELGKFLSKISRIASLIIIIIVSIAMIRISLDQGYSNETLYRLKVLFGHKSLISTYLFLLIPLNLLGIKAKNENTGVILLVVAQILMILLIQSRSMYLALVFFMIIVTDYFVRHRKDWSAIVKKRHFYISVFGVTLILILILGNAGFRERLNVLNYLKSQTATERQDIWRMTKPLIQEHWLTGVGSGNWKMQFPAHGVEGSYRLQDQNVFFTRAHNDFLELWAELGILGLLAYVSIFGFALYKLHRCRNQHPWQSRMLLAGIVGFVISSLIDFPKERMEFLTMLVIYLILIDLIPWGHQTRHLSARSLLVIIIVLMSANVYTGILRYQGERNTVSLLKARNEGKWEKAIEFSQIAENPLHHFDPYSVPIQFYRGIANFEIGNLEQAQTAFKIAHKYSPYNFHILNNLATIALEKKNYPEADQWLTEAIRINSRFEDALYNLSYSKAMQGQYSEALEILETVPSQSEKKQMYRQEIINLQKGSKK